jgi:hypothetical protein
VQPGPYLAGSVAMFYSGPATIIGGLLFSSIGFVAFIYGKRMNRWKPMFCGIVLMVYPYFVANAAIIYAIGALGTAALYFLRE